jgi:hypothetical protein
MVGSSSSSPKSSTLKKDSKYSNVINFLENKSPIVGEINSESSRKIGKSIESEIKLSESPGIFVDESFVESPSGEGKKSFEELPSTPTVQEEKKQSFMNFMKSFAKLIETKDSKKLKKKGTPSASPRSFWSTSPSSSTPSAGETENSEFQDMIKLETQEKPKRTIKIERKDNHEDSKSPQITSPRTPRTPRTPRGLEFLLTPTKEENHQEEIEDILSSYKIAKITQQYVHENITVIQQDELVIIVEETENECKCYFKEMELMIPKEIIFEINFKAFQKRKHIVNEFITTERTYVKNLNHLNNYFVVPLSNTAIISEETHKSLFSSLKIVLGINVLFLNKLQQIAKKNYISQDFELSSLLLEFSQAFKLYTDFIVGFDLSNEILKKEKESNSKFEKFLKETQTELNEKGLLVDISSYLVLPVQRLPRYRLFLEDLLRVSEFYFSFSLEYSSRGKFDEIQSIAIVFGRNFTHCFIL